MPPTATSVAATQVCYHEEEEEKLNKLKIDILGTIKHYDKGYPPPLRSHQITSYQPVWDAHIIIIFNNERCNFECQTRSRKEKEIERSKVKIK